MDNPIASLDGAWKPPVGFPRPPAGFCSDEYARRIKRFRLLLARRGIDGAIITRAVSRRYLTGFESSAGMLAISADNGAIFSVDFRYILMARKAMPFLQCVERKREAPDPLAAFARKWRTAGYEARDSKEKADRLSMRFGNIGTWIAIDDDISSLRAIKSLAERKAIRAAVSQNDALYSWALQKISPGMSEWQIRNIIRSGADVFGHGESFDTIVCAGRNAAECHHNPDETIFRRDSLLLMDFGVLLDGYHSDMTRCVCFGKPTPLCEKIHKIVLEANRKAIDAIKPGMTGREVDAIARNVIAKAGYGDAFGHSLGHSVGLEIHESPNFSQVEKGIIKPGMTITVEPGIYLPGRLGIRIEDVVLVTPKGCEVLTKSDRQLKS